jgi:hypothetical protein
LLETILATTKEITVKILNISGKAIIQVEEKAIVNPRATRKPKPSKVPTVNAVVLRECNIFACGFKLYKNVSHSFFSFRASSFTVLKEDNGVDSGLSE